MATDSSSGLAELDYSAFKRKVKLAYGLDLEAYKRTQMERRLRATMERCGANTFQQYFGMIQDSKALLDEFLDRVTINVSELFRNPEHFEVLRRTVLPELLRRTPDLRVWSAGCSCGAEAYTLAILLEETGQSGKHSILATDIDDRMLARAREGLYQEHEVRNISGPRLAKYFERTQSGWKAGDGLKALISFQKHDMLKDAFRFGFDLIVCRNVVIYFTDEAKSALYQRFYRSLKPSGYLFVGGTERIAGCSEIGYENPFPFFYKKPGVS